MKLRSVLLFALVPALSSFAAGEKVKIASFSTVLTEVAQAVGQDHVQVVGLRKLSKRWD